MTRLTHGEFKELKQAIKETSIAEVAEDTNWSKSTLRRIKKARSLKQYRELCRTM